MRRIVGYCGMTCNWAWCDDGSLWYWPIGGPDWQEVKRPPIPDTLTYTFPPVPALGISMPTEVKITYPQGGNADAKQETESQSGPVARPQPGTGRGVESTSVRKGTRQGKAGPETPPRDPEAGPRGR